jgi:hypothetical protein
MTNSFDPNARPSLQRLGSEIKFHKRLVDNGICPSCISCEHWGMNTNANGLSIVGSNPGARAEMEETCRLYKGRPPAEVIVLGCSSWEWDIPF